MSEVVWTSATRADCDERSRCGRHHAEHQTFQRRPHVTLRGGDAVTNDDLAVVVDDSCGELGTTDVNGQVHRIHGATVAALTLNVLRSRLPLHG